MDNEMMAQVCNGLSEVCILLSKQKQEDEEFMKDKIKIMKEYNPKDKNIEVIKSLMKKKGENHKKYAKEFKKKAKVFRELGKLQLKYKEDKNGKK